METIRFSIGEVYSEDLSNQLGRIENQVDDKVCMLIKAGTGGLQKGSALSIDKDFLASAVESEIAINGVAICDVPEGYYSLVYIKGVNITVNGDGNMVANKTGISVGAGATKGQVKPASACTVIADFDLLKSSNIVGMGADALSDAETVIDPVSGNVIKATAATTATTIFFLDPNNMLSTLFHVGDTLDGCIAGDEVITAIDEANPAVGTTRITIANTQVATNVPATRKKVEGLCRLV